MKARKIIICVLATLSLSSLAFAQKSGRYVNSKDGLNIRAEPNTRAEKVGAFKYGEFVEVAGEGEKASIDGIEARWTKIIIDRDGLAPEDNYLRYGLGVRRVFARKMPDERSGDYRLPQKTQRDGRGLALERVFPRKLRRIYAGK